MIQYSFYDHTGKKYNRIDKRTAKKAYAAGKTIYLCASNLRPFTMHAFEYPLNRKNRESYVIDNIGLMNDFENLINSYMFYNCINNETGKRVNFYMEVI